MKYKAIYKTKSKQLAYSYARWRKRYWHWRILTRQDYIAEGMAEVVLQAPDVRIVLSGDTYIVYEEQLFN